MIEARYTALEILNTAIGYNLDYEEFISAIMTECDFKKTLYPEYFISVLIARFYYFMKAGREDERYTNNR